MWLRWLWPLLVVKLGIELSWVTVKLEIELSQVIEK